MSICLSENFNENNHSYSLLFNQFKGENNDDLIEYIYSVLEGLPFSTDINNSEDPQNYKDSINNLVKCVIKNIGDSMQLTPQDKMYVRKGLLSKLIPIPLTKAEEAISAVVEGTDLIKQSEIDKMKYNKVIQSIYGQTNISVDNWRLRNFEDALGGATIFKINGGLVDNNWDLNNNIIDYQNQQYNIIREYLTKYYFPNTDVSVFPKNYYTSSRIDSNVRIQTANSQNTLTAMYNIINHLKNNGSFKDMLEQGWNEDIIGDIKSSSNRELFNAVTAYINLVYFDETLKGSNANFVSVSKQDMPIEVSKDTLGNINYSYKYKIQVGNTNAIKTWGVDNPDAIRLVSNFNKFLINRIPIYNQDSGKKQWGRLETKDFIGTITKLKEIGSTIQSDNSFRNNCIKLTDNTSIKNGALQQVFNNLFVQSKISIIKELKEKGFDKNNLDILYSIYHTVFDVKNKNSWINLEDNYLQKGKGFRSRYNLVNNIYGIICSNSASNYLNTTYNSETGEIETSVKEKYNINSTKFDIKNSINSATQDRIDRKELLEKYSLAQQEDERSYSIKIGNSIYSVLIQDSTVNILSKKKNSSKFKVPEFDKFKDIDLSSTTSRDEIINSAKGIQYEFKQLLSFISDMLDMNFIRSSEDLNELNLCMIGDKNFLKDLFLSATRALVVTDIYDKFYNAKKSDGTTYAKTELEQYMIDTGKWKSIAGLKSKETSEFFDKTNIGNQLNVVYVNEPWVTKIARVRAILAQDTVTSVINDLDGNKNPNTSPVYLSSSGEIKNQIRISNAKAGPTAYLLFSKNLNAIVGSTINLDIQTSNFDTKQVKGMTQQELIYDAIINKFFVPFIKTGNIFTQCTTQSDKTKFIATQVNLADLGFQTSSLSSQNLEPTVVTQYLNTIGEAYKRVYQNVVDDYSKVFPELTSVSKINNALQGRIPALTTDGTQIVIKGENDLIKAVNEYNKNHPEDKVIFYKDLSYRVTNKGLAFNELLYDYANNLYGSETNFKQRLQLEKIRFLNNLTDNQVFIEYSPQIKNIFNRLFIGQEDSWVKRIGRKSYLILAKANNKDVLYGKIKENSQIQLNPMLNAYFLIDNLVGNNLRFATTGSEINHKIKALGKLDLKKILLNSIAGSENSDLLLTQLQSMSMPDNITFFDLNLLAKQVTDLAKINPEYSELANILNLVYNDQIYAMENLGQNAQFKRNVIMSATMTKMVPSLEGITEEMKIACIADIPADVFNFSGMTDKVDAHDGSALTSGLWSILENKSLGSNEVGDIKKPIHHYYDDKYMTATLLKYATDAITNNWMRQSVGNDANFDGLNHHAIDLHHIFKKMHNVRWHDVNGNWKDGKIDLINGCEFKQDGEINFKRDILEQDQNADNQLYYNKAGQHIRICDFGIENGVYYTKEQAFNTDPTEATGKLTKVYHYFDNNSNHIPSTELRDDLNLHTIDSLFELHTALGGIWSEKWNGQNYEYSEGSMIATVNYINNVCTLKEGSNPKDISIESYDQPLKRAMIHMLANNSAVKNGVGNINPQSSWYDESEFSYITIGTHNYGIQQDSDHTADEAHMTEFSQVISSLDAGGQLHDYVSQIYEELGQTAISLAQVELDAVENFRATGDKSVLYDVIGRTIMANLKSGNSSIGLAEAIISNIKSKFNLNTNHILDQLKIPFSDPNIYSQIISTFVSNLNSKSIKRQYPGLGTVMAPSFNMSMIYDIREGGDYQQYQFTDLIKLARSNKFTSTKLDNTQANQDIVKQFLASEQEKEPIEITPTVFLPTDNVLCTFNSENGEQKVHISFKGVLDYYNFQENPEVYLRNKGYQVLSAIKFQRDITIPRNLAPVRIEFDYSINNSSGDTITKHTNIFNSYRIKRQIIGLESISKNKELSKQQKKQLSEALKKECNVDSVFTLLKQGKFELEDGSIVEISNLKNKPAEIIMSNLYATKFGIRSGDSLMDVLKKGEKYFEIPKLDVESDTYDLAFTRGTGDHLFITFKPLQGNTNSFKSKSKEWENVNKVNYTSEYTIASDSPKVVNRIYATTKDNIRMFEVGREVINNNVVWDSTQKCFVQNGKRVDNQKKFRRNGNDVLEYIEFISSHEVTETFANGVKKTYTLYNINRSAIQKCLEYKDKYSDKELTRRKKDPKTKEVKTYKASVQEQRNTEVNSFISKLLYDMYCTDSFAGININKQLSSGSRAVLNNTLRKLSNNIGFDPDLKEYVNKLAEKVQTATFNKDLNYYQIKSDFIKNEYYKKMRKKQLVSFQKSLEFTVARIPAQTLQSFMKMKNVGFTGTKTGQCYVTAWQTWLQGSDYRQNCSL